MGLCLATATAVVTLAASSFTIAWTHSTEKVRWEEDYRIAETRLELVEARIQGAGAGMEPPDGARLDRGWWRYAPALRWHDALRLTRSPYADDYELCANSRCRPLGELAPQASGVTQVYACDEATPAPPPEPRS